jgi:uncharacterized SAM-binding protein YcdF (DUF218 family)
MQNNHEVKGKYVGKRILLWLICACVLAVTLLSIDIYTYPRGEIVEKADAAVVLGAAIWTNQPSPVLRERLNHAIVLYKAKNIKKIIVTGGFGEGEKFSEAEIAEKYLLENGVLESDILKETQSKSTFENIKFSAEIIRDNQFSMVLIVSDSMHLRRALWMASDLGLNAFPSPTTTSRYQSFSNRFGFLMREVYFFTKYLVIGSV